MDNVILHSCIRTIVRHHLGFAVNDDKPMHYVLDSGLTDRETYLIGQILVGWGTLEFTIFAQTLETFDVTETEGAKLPKAMNNLRFLGVLELWEERVVNQASEEHSKVLRKQLEEIGKLKPVRDALVHGMWQYSKEDVSRISTIRIRNKEIIEFHFSADDLQDFQQRLAKINFAVTYPGGRDDYFGEIATEGGFVSRRFLAIVTGDEVVQDWHDDLLDADEPESKDDA